LKKKARSREGGGPFSCLLSRIAPMRYPGAMNASAAISLGERRPLTASDFELLFEAGALDDMRRAELIDGDIYGMSPQTNRHGLTKSRLGVALANRLTAIGSSLEAVLEVSAVVAETSVPEPDVMVSSFKGEGFIPADTIALVVEVALSTLDTDLGRKAELYAAAAIPEYWVVDVNAERVVLHTRPGMDGYAEKAVVPYGEPLVSTAVEGLSIDSGVLRF
jgi:Uma2 family endonuclease